MFSDKNVENLSKIKTLEKDEISTRKSTIKPTSSIDVKINDTQETKSSSKKITLKSKSELKKPVSKDVVEAATNTSDVVVPSVVVLQQRKINNETTKVTEKKIMTELPVLLVRGEPVITHQQTTDVPPSSASRARALNVSASEPANTLHPNVTDLSDVSMDDEDKEVEGIVCELF